jgi:glutamate dehydrogenase
MGFKVVDERTYRIVRKVPEQADVWLHDMMLERADGGAVDLDANQRALEAAFLKVMSGGAENDGYNALVLAGALMWREVALLRCISRFLRQVRVPYSQDYMWATLVKHAAIAADVVHLFEARFDPRPAIAPEERSAREATVVAAIEAALQHVQSLDEDRILRHFVNAVQAAIPPISIRSSPMGSPGSRSPSSSQAAGSTPCRCPSRSMRFSSTPRASRGSICASAKWLAAASAGPTGRRTSAPKF